MMASAYIGLWTAFEIKKWQDRGMIWFGDRVMLNKIRNSDDGQWTRERHGYINAFFRMILIMMNSLIVGVGTHNWLYWVVMGVAFVADQCYFKYLNNGFNKLVMDVRSGIKINSDYESGIVFGCLHCGYYYIVYNVFIIALNVAMFVNVYNNVGKFDW